MKARKSEIDDFLYLRVEGKYRKQHRQNLAEVVEGPYEVTNVDSPRVIIQTTGRLV